MKWLRVTLFELLLLPLAFLLMALLVSMQFSKTQPWLAAAPGYTQSREELARLGAVWDADERPLLGTAKVEEINAWLARDLPEVHWLKFHMQESVADDPWGNPYRCVDRQADLVGGDPSLHFFTTGVDGESATAGDDADDINTWDPESGPVYWRAIAAQQRRWIFIPALLLTPLGYGFVVAVKRRLWGWPFEEEDTAGEGAGEGVVE